MKRPQLILTLTFLVVSSNSFATTVSDTTIIKSHLTAITKTGEFRTYKNIDQLNKTAEYIKSVFNQYADSVFIQAYLVNGQVYKNVICSYGTQNTKRIIVGAHYDVCDNQEGADDNASGVIGLLELSRLLKGQKLKQRIDLVAYTLEEPPYFRTEYMGSYIHAKSLVDNKTEVYGMVSLEMIGYFRDEKKSQSYPIGLLSLFYGNKGNYITLIKKFGAGRFTRKFCRTYKQTRAIKTKKFAGPPALPGIDFSDHLNYWKFGFSALMLTDTAFFRNKNYHEPTDTMETLDLKMMAKVIDGVYNTLTTL
jgi:Zn-dependent M28 family amino/carboxypeptidase